METFPPHNGGDRGRGYQTLESPSGMLVIYKISISHIVDLQETCKAIE